MKTLRTIALEVVLLTMLAFSAVGDGSSNSMLGITVDGAVHYGPVDGFFQIPTGGNPGSSSPGRPTLDELDIHDAVFYDVLATVQWRQLNFYAGYQLIGLDGDATLDQALTSSGVAFPVGDHIQSQVNLNWLRVGGGWTFELANDRLELMPHAEYALLAFDYKLTGTSLSTERSFTKGCVRLGLEGRYHLNRVISVRLDADGSLPISDMPQILTITRGVEFDLLPESRHLRPKFLIGGCAQRIEYEDSQTMPNHFRLDMGPFFTAGLGIHF